MSKKMMVVSQLSNSISYSFKLCAYLKLSIVKLVAVLKEKLIC